MECYNGARTYLKKSTKSVEPFNVLEFSPNCAKGSNYTIDQKK